MKRVPMAPQGAAESLLAALAGDFPDLIDPTCERARKLSTDPEELIEWLTGELKKFTEVAHTRQRGAIPRIGRMLLYRARGGEFGSKREVREGLDQEKL
jgi:hypothetical protein